MRMGLGAWADEKRDCRRNEIEKIAHLQKYDLQKKKVLPRLRLEGNLCWTGGSTGNGAPGGYIGHAKNTALIRVKRGGELEGKHKGSPGNGEERKTGRSIRKLKVKGDEREIY